MPGISPRAYTVLLAVGACVIAALVPSSVAFADAANPADWTVATPTRVVLDAAWARGRIHAPVELGGLLLYDPVSGDIDQFTTADGLGSNLAQCVGVSPDGEVWVGTADAGITRIFPDGGVRLLTALPDQLNVRALAFSGDNAWYGGPSGGGRIVSGLPERSFTSEDGLVDEDVRAVAARGSQAWFGTAAGISEFDIQANELATINDGLTDLDVRAMVVAGDEVYAGTATALLVLDESGATPVWAPVAPPLNVEVVDLAAQGDLLVVLGTDRRVWWRSDPADSWQSTQAGVSGHRFTAVTIDDAGEIHLGGRRADTAPIGTDVTPLFVDLSGAESSYFRQLYGDQFFGMGEDRDGGAWLGSFPPSGGAMSHWRADGSVVVYDAEESGNAIDGFNNDGWLPKLKIDVLESQSGDVWVSAFQEGLTRMTPAANDDPAAATYEQVTSDTSALDMNRVFSIGEDPHGNLWFCAAGEIVAGTFNAGIDVLLDPAHPELDANWVHIRDSNSELAGAGLFRISFEGDRVAWLTVRGTGIQRFEYGDGNGFDLTSLDDPLRWRTISALPEFVQPPNLGAAREVAVDDDGRHWVATDGEGVFSFRVRAFADTTVVSSVRQYRMDSFGSRLLSNNVFSIAVDPYGDVWAATSVGLNRIREGGDDPGTAAFTDLQNFLDFELGVQYSPQILRPMAGGVPVSIEFSSAAPLMFAATARGLTRVDLVPMAPPPPDENAPAFTIYPNPVRAGDDRVIVSGFTGEADVEIYDLQGRKIRSTTASAGDDVWSLQTLSGDPVANGMYLVRVIKDGQSSSRVLAVER